MDGADDILFYLYIICTVLFKGLKQYIHKEGPLTDKNKNYTPNKPVIYKL